MLSPVFWEVRKAVKPAPMPETALAVFASKQSGGALTAFTSQAIFVVRLYLLDTGISRSYTVYSLRVMI